MYNKFIFSTIHKVYYFLIAYTLVCIIFIYGYNQLPHYEEQFKKVVLHLSIEGVDASTDRTIKTIFANEKDIYRSNLFDTQKRTGNEKELQKLKHKNISSVYIVIPKKENLIFLLDGCNGNRGEFGQLFQPVDMNIFRKIQQTKSKEIFIQDGIKDLGFTLVKPIIKNETVVAFLLIDYTQKSLDNFMSSVRNVVDALFKVILISLSLVFITGIYFIYITYKKYKRYKVKGTDAYKRTFLTDNYERIYVPDYYIALVDIDFFKRINDIYGEQEGNSVIKEVIKKITPFLAKSDALIQYGGGEFLLLIEKKNLDIETFKYKMEDIRIAIERLNLVIANNMEKVTISIGTLINSERTSLLQDAIHNADAALYYAKHNGRNRVCHFDITDEKKLYREKLKEMIESDQLVCHYQPINNLNSLECHHYEALLRIEDDDKIIYPDKILPDLEDSYFYSRLSMKVIAYNVEKLKENSGFIVSINLSSDDLLNDAIISLLVSNSDIANRMLIEILENRDVDYRQVELAIQKLKHYGYQICIDDFGSGYSNLDHLLNLSIDYLKLDGSIVRNLHKDKRAHSIIQAITVFCQQNGIEVIAEFVENEEIVEILKGFGIEYGQGYYFSRAMPYEALEF